MDYNFYKLGIIGKPLSHSISPLIQIAALKSVNLDGSYECFEISETDIVNQINYFKKNNFRGFNVTIPHKISIIKYLDKIDKTAEKIGAVNTVLIDDNKKLTGYNTDISGFQTSLPKEITLKNAKILGSGGAALAVTFALNNLNCKNITIYNRNKNKAEEFIKQISAKINARLIADSFDNLTSSEDTDILINATPLGTKGVNENLSPIKEVIMQTAKSDIFLYDLVYNPQETAFLKLAKKYSKEHSNGLNMLLLQGAKSFEIWTGKSPDTNVMKKAALEALN